MLEYKVSMVRFITKLQVVNFRFSLKMIGEHPCIRILYAAINFLLYSSNTFSGGTSLQFERNLTNPEIQIISLRPESNGVNQLISKIYHRGWSLVYRGAFFLCT